MVSNQVDTPSNVTILDMTEDCTRLVFDRLTLNQLIHLRAVCHAWNDIITIICQLKRKLLISFSKYTVRDYFEIAKYLNVDDDPQFQFNKRHILLISKLKGPTSQKALKRASDGSFCEQQNDPNLGIRFIARLFPNITNFVCDTKYERLFELNYILWKWSINLNTLTISFVSSLNRNVISRIAHQDLVKCFEQLSSLKRLHLLLGFDEKLDLSNISTFGQLEEFTFDCCNINLAPYFAQLDANICTLLRVKNHSDCYDSTPNPLDANSEIPSKLTHLSTDFTKDTNHISQHFVKFKNLIQLEILQIQFNTMADVLKKIVPLKKLKILVLGVNLFFHSRDMEAYQNNPNYRNSFPIFHKTITELRLMDKDYKSHLPQIQELQECQLYQLLARIFPIVRKIRIHSNNLNKATFDAQIRPRFSEAFGERVEVTFYQTKKFQR